MDQNEISDYERRIIKRLKKDKRKEETPAKRKPYGISNPYVKSLSKSPRKQSYHQFKILNKQMSVNNNLLLGLLLLTLIPLTFTLVFLVLPSARGISLKFSLDFLLLLYLLAFLFGVFFIGKSFAVKAQVSKMKNELAEAIVRAEE